MRRWTVIIFMAADNDLESFAIKNVHQMEKEGSTESVAFVVQIDRRGAGAGQGAFRGLVTKDPNWDEFTPRIASTLQSIGETDTGDPAVLEDFIVWATQAFPAQQYALILWNHGSGWKPEFMYQAAEDVAGPRMAAAMRSVDFASRFSQQTRRIIFRKTLERRLDSFLEHNVLNKLPRQLARPANMRMTVRGVADLMSEDAVADLIVRAIGLDESSNMDALDSLELEKALAGAKSQIDRRNGGGSFQFELIGFDACLMAGLEVAVQIQAFANWFIGSEEIEPSTGWRYDLLLESFSRSIALHDLVGEIVHDYIVGQSDYKIRLVTQSSIDSSNCVALASQLGQLGTALAPLLNASYRDLALAEKTATRFYDTDFLDIYDYLALVALPEVKDLVDQTVGQAGNVVVASEYAFERGRQHPHGISVYYPTKPVVEPAYETLKAGPLLSGWIDFVKSYHFLPH